MYGYYVIFVLDAIPEGASAPSAFAKGPGT